jgi:hypothetical protein
MKTDLQKKLNVTADWNIGIGDVYMPFRWLFHYITPLIRVYITDYANVPTFWTHTNEEWPCWNDVFEYQTERDIETDNWGTSMWQVLQYLSITTACYQSLNVVWIKVWNEYDSLQK